jgi:hypothetical protein
MRMPSGGHRSCGPGISGCAFAETPKDTLVEGFAIDDIITMDPGEAFELSTANACRGERRDDRP